MICLARLGSEAAAMAYPKIKPEPTGSLGLAQAQAAEEKSDGEHDPVKEWLTCDSTRNDAVRIREKH